MDDLNRTSEQLSGRVERSASAADPDVGSWTDTIVAFRDERDWAEFHSQRNLTAALSVEVGELQEVFLWQHQNEGSAAADEETADVLIYGLVFCHEAGVDPETAVQKKKKLKTAREKYAVEEAPSRATKSADLDDR